MNDLTEYVFAKWARDANNVTPQVIIESFGVSRSTAYRYFAIWKKTPHAPREARETGRARVVQGGKCSLGFIADDLAAIVRAIRARADRAWKDRRKVYVLILPSGEVIATDGRMEVGDQLLARYPMRLVGTYRGLLPASDIRADLECALRELIVRRAA